MKQLVIFLFAIIAFRGLKGQPGTPLGMPMFLISSISPSSGSTGTFVTITFSVVNGGVSFDNVTSVKLGGVPVSSFTLVSPGTINAIVGNGATGSVSLTIPGATEMPLSEKHFTYVPTTAPVISSFLPKAAPTGSTVTIAGKNLTGTTNVSFGGIAAQSFSIINSDTILAVVGDGGSGDVSIITPLGTGLLPGFVFNDSIGSFCPNGNITLHSNITGIAYHWQIFDGSQFIEIADSSKYGDNGLHHHDLMIANVPSSYSGYKYRCIVDGTKISFLFTLKQINLWKGTSGTEWGNIDNWSCGIVPDSNTDVVINSGNVVINSNVTVKSLTVGPTATVTVNQPYSLTVLH